MLNLYQHQPKIRVYKWAVTLQSMGYPLMVSYSISPGNNINWGGLDVRRAYKTYENRHEVSAVLSFNANVDVFPAYLKHPRIECVGDLTYGHLNPKERRNLESARACVFVSDVQMEQAIDRYPSIEEKSFVIYNGLIPEQISEPHKPLIKSDKLQLVFCGSLCDTKGHHRDLAEDFKFIAGLDNVDFHIYAYPYLPERYKGIGAIIHDPVPDNSLVSELSQYDMGLIYWNGNDPIGNCSLSNKFFCYTAAGLDIATKPYRQQLIMDTDNLCLFEDLAEINDFAPPTKKKRLATSKGVITYESQIEKIKAVLSHAI